MANVNTIRWLLAALVEGAMVLEWLWLFGGIRLVNLPQYPLRYTARLFEPHFRQTRYCIRLTRIRRNFSSKFGLIPSNARDERNFAARRF